MTRQPYNDDDAEFDAFLQGKGPLAQGLADLQQPEPPAALDAAILARVAADLGQGAGAGTAAPSGAQAANDSEGPPDFQPRRWRERWRVPVALAAGVTAISIALPLWQDEVALQQQAIHGQMQDMQIPAMPAPAPVEEAAMPTDTAAPAPEVSGPMKDAARPAAPAAMAPAPAAARPQPGIAAAAPAQAAAKAEAARNDAAAEKRDAAAGARKAIEREQAETRAQSMRKPDVYPAPVVEAAPAQAPVQAPAVAPPPPPAPAATPGLPKIALQPQADYRAAASDSKPALARHLAEETVSQPLYPPAVIARIEQLLRDGKRAEALAEWERLRAAYPGYPAPDKLREALEPGR